MTQYKSIRVLSEVYELISAIAKDSKQTISEVIASRFNSAQYMNGKVFQTRNKSNTGSIIYAIDFDECSIQMLHNYPDSNSDTPGTFYSGSFKLQDFKDALDYFKDLRNLLSNRKFVHPPAIFNGVGNLATRNNYGFFYAIFEHLKSICLTDKDIPTRIVDIMS